MTNVWQIAIRTDRGKPHGIYGGSDYEHEQDAISAAKDIVGNLLAKNAMPAHVQEITVLKARYGTWWSDWEKWTFVGRYYSREGLGEKEPNPKDVLPAAKKLAARFGMTTEELANYLLKG